MAMLIDVLLLRSLRIIMWLIVFGFFLLVFEKDVHLLRFNDVFFYDIVGSVIIMDRFFTLLFIIKEINFSTFSLRDSPF